MKRRTFLGATLAALSVALSGLSLSLRAAAAQLACVVKPRRVLLPPVPKWNRKTDDMDCAGFLQQCQDFERTFLPREVVFPRAGQIWEAVRDCEVHVHFCQPIVDLKQLMMWEDSCLRRGERVRILPSDHPKPLSVNFARVRNGAIEPAASKDEFEQELWLKTARTFPVPASGEPPQYFTDLFRFVQDAA
jgi:hypothetical protein